MAKRQENFIFQNLIVDLIFLLFQQQLQSMLLSPLQEMSNVSFSDIRYKQLECVLQVSLFCFILATKEATLRTVPTFVTARTFCASRDTRVSLGWCLLIQEYFCAV